MIHYHYLLTLQWDLTGYSIHVPTDLSTIQKDMPTVYFESDPYIVQTIIKIEYRICFHLLFAIFNNMLFFVRKVNLYLIDIFFLVCPSIFNDKYLNCTLFIRPTFETMALLK